MSHHPAANVMNPLPNVCSGHDRGDIVEVLFPDGTWHKATVISPLYAVPSATTSIYSLAYDVYGPYLEYGENEIFSMRVAPDHIRAFKGKEPEETA
jgi:hypothetical protein